jgi:hypothetical protein
MLDDVVGHEGLVAGRQDSVCWLGSGEATQGALVAPCGQEDEVVASRGSACGEAGEHAWLGESELDRGRAERVRQLVGGARARHGVEDPQDRCLLVDGVMVLGRPGSGRGPLRSRWPSPGLGGWGSMRG